MKFFRMTRDKGERLPVFLARLEAARRELRSMFNLVVTDEDFKSVMQENSPLEVDFLVSYSEQEGAASITC